MPQLQNHLGHALVAGELPEDYQEGWRFFRDNDGNLYESKDEAISCPELPSLMTKHIGICIDGEFALASKGYNGGVFVTREDYSVQELSRNEWFQACKDRRVSELTELPFDPPHKFQKNLLTAMKIAYGE